jgi:hypothetical protein
MQLHEIITKKSVISGKDHIQRNIWPAEVTWTLHGDSGQVHFRQHVVGMAQTRSAGAGPDDVLATDWQIIKVD